MQVRNPELKECGGNQMFKNLGKHNCQAVSRLKKKDLREIRCQESRNQTSQKVKGAWDEQMKRNNEKWSIGKTLGVTWLHSLGFGPP